MPKTFAYWKEKYGGFLIGIVCAIITFWLNPDISKWDNIIQNIPTITMAIFGFLLTFLGIILQGDSDMIKWMKIRKILFQRFISFNKRIVILSFVLSIFAFFLGNFNFEWLMKILIRFPFIVPFLIRTLISIFLFLLVWLLVDTFRFTRIFYLLIQKNDNNQKTEK